MRKTLMTRIASEETLYAAWRKVRANRGAAGSDAVTISQFEERLTDHLAGLGRRLRDETYLPGALRRTTFPKRDGSLRELAIPTVMDRVAQRAFVDVLEPLFEAQFLDCNWGFRPARGVDGAVQAVLGHRQAGYIWAVDADITRFFDSIHIPILMELLRQTVTDRSVLRTIHLWLAAGTLTAPPGNGAQTWLNSVAGGAREVSQEVLDYVLGRDNWPHDFVANSDSISGADAERQGTWRKLGRDAIHMAFQFRHLLSPYLAGKAVVIGGGLGAATLGAALICRHLDRPTAAALGTPQGAPLSPLLANIYLHRFDKALTRRGLRLVRYADDFIICCASSPRTTHALATVRLELAALRLTLNEAKTQIVGPEQEFVFLGHLFDAEGAIPVLDERRPVRTALDTARQRGRWLASGAQARLAGTGQDIVSQVHRAAGVAGRRLRTGSCDRSETAQTQKGER